MSFPFSLVLHTHLPMVVNHGRWPHGSDWLNEATFECYLPLLETAHRLVAEGLSPKWTINLSPVLVEQLASPEFQKELAFYYQNVRRACTESRAHFQRDAAVMCADPDVLPSPSGRGEQAGSSPSGRGESSSNSFNCAVMRSTLRRLLTNTIVERCWRISSASRR